MHAKVCKPLLQATSSPDCTSELPQRTLKRKHSLGYHLGHNESEFLGLGANNLYFLKSILDKSNVQVCDPLLLYLKGFTASFEAGEKI